MKLIYLFSFLLFIRIRESQSYSDGAPDDRVCVSMTPNHGSVPQSAESPYIIRLSKTNIKGGESVLVTLSSKNGATEFIGFLSMGQKIEGGTVKSTGTGLPIGKFDLPASSSGTVNNPTKHVKCGSITDGAVTHTGPDGKKSVSFNWIAPNEDGDFVILATFVEAKQTYWVKQPSDTIHVKRDAGFVENKPTTTTPAPKSEKKELSDGSTKLLDEYYKGCGKTKGCFGLPVGCVTERKCEMFTTFRVEGSRHIFQVSGAVQPEGSGNRYVAVGLSFDEKMGADSVTGCVLEGEKVGPKSYYNIGKNNKAMSNITAGLETIVDGKGHHIDGIIFCEFTRSPKLELQEDNLKLTFNLGTDEYYFIMSRGPAPSLDKKLGKHPTNDDKGVSDSAYPLSYTGVLGAKSNILIELHAGLMIIAWLMCASTGMFTARYYKQTHTDFNPLNKAFWFVLHITCMFTTVFLTVCGGIIIFIEIGGYSKNLTGPGQLHPILGLVLEGLAITQVLIAFLRPHPGTPKRSIFNWVHWSIGNSAHIVGIACIFLAKDLDKSGLNKVDSYLFVVTGFVIFHVAMHVVMSIHTVWADKQMDTQVRLRAVRPGPMKPSGKSDEAPGTGFRTFILTLYLVGCASVAITLIVLIVNGL